jgi:hypothetical protein
MFFRILLSVFTCHLFFLQAAAQKVESTGMLSLEGQQWELRQVEQGGVAQTVTEAKIPLQVLFFTAGRQLQINEPGSEKPVKANWEYDAINKFISVFRNGKETMRITELSLDQMIINSETSGGKTMRYIYSPLR